MRLPPGMGFLEPWWPAARPRRSSRTDARFATQIAAGTGYTPHTMLCVPLMRNDRAIGVLSVLDRRDGGLYGPGDMERASLFADLAIIALEVEPGFFTGLGQTRTLPGRQAG